MATVIAARLDIPSAVTTVRNRKQAERLFGKGSIVAESRLFAVDTLSVRDANLLQAYLGEIQAQFERSVFGPMLDRAAADAMESKPCSSCNGKDSRFPGLILVNRKRQNPITGVQEVYEFADDCPLCHGTAFLPKSRRQRRKAPRTGIRRCWRCKGAVGDRECRVCRGEGFTTPKVCFSTGEPGASGSTPRHDSLVRYGIASRRLNAVYRLCPTSYHALVLYHGDMGAKWGRTKHGRIFALLPLTKSGQRLASLPSKRDVVHLNPIERLSVAVELQTIQPKDARGELIVRARLEAETIYRMACVHWNSTKAA